jgi:hypothetical protein
MAPFGSSEILTVVWQAAERHQIAAKLTGAAAGRPRAWLDDAAEARRQTVRYTLWLAVTAVALAGTVVLVVWGATHQGNYYLATLGGPVALGCLLMMMWARKEREQYLGRRPKPPGRRHEGDWFTVPLKEGKGIAAGAIARTEPRANGVVLTYFFAPGGVSAPTPDQLAKLRASDAALVGRLDSRDMKVHGDWPILGPMDGWDRNAWPVPAFGRTDNKTGQCFKVIYDDKLRFVGEDMIDRSELDSLPSSELLEVTNVATALTDLLPLASASLR